MKHPLLLCALLSFVSSRSQDITNTVCTNPVAEQVLKGEYDPAEFAANTTLNDHQEILCELRTAVSADSLRSHLQHLVSFHNRNTFSDTLSATTGIGAARRWAFAKFQEFSAANESRLLPAYLSFDYSDPVCGDLFDTRNVFAVLPGSHVADPSIIIIEAHMDSRCADNCDTACVAQGADDNGSGSALVVELARVLSRYTFDHTLVFMLTTGEEHGLVGATAMAEWCTAQGITIKGVQNNDVVGGIWCGATSSEPGCEVEGSVDSLQVRLFSYGTPTKPHRGFARTIKMYYEEKLRPHVPVPMTVSVMPMEDRENRGGDHIPFRIEGYRNVRFTAANEHGDANVEDTTYHDRQHTSDDILGVDTDGDLEIDSFFVDFNYLQRGSVINGMSAVLMALGPEPPAFTVNDEPAGLRVDIVPTPDLMEWRIGIRQGSTTTQFAALYRTNTTSFSIPGLNAGIAYYVSVAGIDSAGIMSPFSSEVARVNDADTPPGTQDDLPYGLNCAPIGIVEPVMSTSPITLTCQPNPMSTRASLTLAGEIPRPYGEVEIIVRNVLGQSIARLMIPSFHGTTRVEYLHHAGPGLFTATLMADGHPLAAGKIVAVE